MERLVVTLPPLCNAARLQHGRVPRKAPPSPAHPPGGKPRARKATGRRPAAVPESASGGLHAVAAKLAGELLERRDTARLRVRAPRLQTRQELLLPLRLLRPQRLQSQLEVVDRPQRCVG